MTDVRRTVAAVWKLESAAVIGTVTRLVRDVGLAEELAQDAVVAALEQWPESGVPDNPGAWLMTTAKRRAIDHVRRSERLGRHYQRLAHELDQPRDVEHDDVLRLVFLSCHPVLPTEQRVALTLRLVAGLTAAEIARAFLTTEREITRRVTAAKEALAASHAPFELPAGTALADRLSSVLEVVYLVFNEGYSATAGDDLLRPALCQEALRLGRLLAVLAPDEAEVHGLVALMEIQASRSAARTGPGGEPVRLHEQNRGRWDQLLIRRGFAAMLRARDLGGPPGPYVLQAAIAVCHAQARTAADTDWPRIATLYDALVRLRPTPIVRLNRAVAVGFARGPAAGLALVDELTADRALAGYHLLPSVRGDLLAQLDRLDEAAIEFARAAALTRNSPERTFLLTRASTLPQPDPAGTATAGPDPTPSATTAEPGRTPGATTAGPRRAVGGAGVRAGLTLGEAADGFLGREGLDAGTRRSYGQTVRRLCLALGGRRPLATLTAGDVAGVFELAWGDAAARTWNRHRSAARSFAAWAAVPDLAAGLDRREADPARVPAIPDDRLDLLWRLDVPLRDRTLWRLLHESGAAVRAVLGLDVERLDLDDRRARTGTGWLGWRAATARLLPDLVAGRSAGPLFRTDRRAGPARTADLCPHTGRARLSYERAEYLFKRATRPLDPTGRGYTLRQLRP